MSVVQNKEQSTENRKVAEVVVGREQQPKIPVMTARQINNVASANMPLSMKGIVGKAEEKEQLGGKKFLLLEIQDSTGVISAKIWHESYIKVPVRVKDILLNTTKEAPVCVAVGGLRDEWNGIAYINVKGLKISETDDIMKYVPSTAENINDMYQYILDTVGEINGVLGEVLVDKLTENRESFINSPAAKRYHDNYRGGLLEHTYKMLLVFASVSNAYKNINRDVMIYIIVMHDFLKIHGYTLLPSIEWTYQEDLVGHQVMGAITAYNDLKSRGVPDETIMAIINALISHHGRVEWGAAKPAMTVEARLLAHLDYMISDVAKASQMIVSNEGQTGKIEKDLYFTEYKME